MRGAIAIVFTAGCVVDGPVAAEPSFEHQAAVCATIGYAGAVIDDGDACFEPGGPLSSMRHVTSAGKDGDLTWTYTTDDAAESNYGEWHLAFEHAGRYKVEVYTDAAYAKSKQATYVVQAGAASEPRVVDQTALDGWQTLGELEFVVGGGQWVRVADNTGEPLANKVQLAFDALRVTRVETETGSEDDAPPRDEGGCTVGGHAGLALVALLAGLRRRRRCPAGARVS